MKGKDEPREGYIDDVVIGPGGKLNGRYDPGEPVLSDASVQLLQRNLDTGNWAPWDGTPTGQPNPQTTDALGRYGFYYLPAGEYRLQVTPSQAGLAPATTRSTIVWNGSTESCSSKSSSSIESACSEKTEKLTPPLSTVAPSG